MPDFRSYAAPASANPKTIELSPEESHHLISVNRAQTGATVTAFNGKGTEWIGTLSVADRKRAVLEIVGTQKAPPLPFHMTLGQCLPKGGTMDDIVRKATEVGAARIVPLQAERTEVHLDDDRSAKKLEKWRTAALEAAKQCGNPWLPEIAPFQSASAFMQASSGYDLKLIASLQAGAKSLKAVLNGFRTAQGQAPKHVLWLVGPEGDFTPAELAQSKLAGFEPITLGPLVLRCDTAAIYALSVLSYELQN